ncbi:hypothetical protein T11_2325 [Trichinella zimbabwensis]|uniref:Uncharacterized protein n=1 Tax=Trichinella zimbabwensis TaxID=268475 RepID=A0A0V1I3N4_9BILA|nr:hypothetical protein T11_2325 [Trichinella zimbabwensis]
MVNARWTTTISKLSQLAIPLALYFQQSELQLYEILFSFNSINLRIIRTLRSEVCLAVRGILSDFFPLEL